MNIDRIKSQAKKLEVVYGIAYSIYVFYLYLKKKSREFRHRERHCSYGEENPDKIFYVIGVPHTTGGLFAIVKSVYCHICYALQKEYIPVVDMDNFKNQLSGGTDGGNTWEYYFKQPCGYTLDDIKKSKNVILSASLPYPKGVEIGFGTPINHELHSKNHTIYNKYIIPSNPVSTYIETKLKSVLPTSGKVLGVLCRGTDYTENKPTGHPIQPNKEQAINHVEKVMAERGYDFVFLATEDQAIYSTFSNHFGNRLLFSGQKLYSGMMGKKYLSEIPVADHSEKWQNIVDYYATIYILSKCDGIVAGLTCGSICAYLMSERYEYVYFWNLGKYK